MLRHPEIERRIRERARLRRPGLARPLTGLESGLLRAAAVALWTGAAVVLARPSVVYVLTHAEATPQSIAFWPLFLAPAWLLAVLVLAREMLYGPLASSAIGILAPLPVADEGILEHFRRRALRNVEVLAALNGVFLLLVLHVGHGLTLATAAGTVVLMCLQAAAAFGLVLLVAQRLPTLTREYVLAVVALVAVVGFSTVLGPFLDGQDPGREPWVALVVPTGWLPLAWSQGLVLGDRMAWLCLIVPIALALLGPFVWKSMRRVYRIREVAYLGPRAYVMLGEPTGDIGEAPEELSTVTRAEALEHLRAEGLLASESTWRASGAANRLLARLLTDEERRVALLVLPDDPMRARRLALGVGILAAGAVLSAITDAGGSPLVFAVLLASMLALPLRGGAFAGFDPWPTGSGYTPLHAPFPLDHRVGLGLMIKVGALRTALFAPFLVAALTGLGHVSGIDGGAGAGALYASKALTAVLLAQPYYAALRLLRATTGLKPLAPAMLVRIVALCALVLLGVAAVAALFLTVAWVSLAPGVVLAASSVSFAALAFRHFDRGTVDLTITRR